MQFSRSRPEASGSPSTSGTPSTSASASATISKPSDEGPSDVIVIKEEDGDDRPTTSKGKARAKAPEDEESMILKVSKMVKI